MSRTDKPTHCSHCGQKMTATAHKFVVEGELRASDRPTAVARAELERQFAAQRAAAIRLQTVIDAGSDEHIVYERDGFTSCGISLEHAKAVRLENLVKSGGNRCRFCEDGETHPAAAIVAMLAKAPHLKLVT